MEQLTFSQHVAANGGSLPWQDAVRLTLLTIQTISAQADPETTYMDVCPEQIVLSKDAREVLSCGKPHSLKEWDAADAANPQLLPWEFWNAWSARTPAAQVYPVAACLFGALSGHLPMAAKARLNGAALRTLTDIPDALNNVLQKGLALNAADRWPSLQAFRAALVDATKIEIAVDDTPEKTDDTPALQAGQLDLSKVRTVDAPRGPQAGLQTHGPEKIRQAWPPAPGGCPLGCVPGRPAGLSVHPAGHPDGGKSSSCPRQRPRLPAAPKPRNRNVKPLPARQRAKQLLPVRLLPPPPPPAKLRPALPPPSRRSPPAAWLLPRRHPVQPAVPRPPALPAKKRRSPLLRPAVHPARLLRRLLPAPRPRKT